ncbi:O-antigen ligase family protein [Aquimarina sp. 2201CG14-23]|uniref:O-antigen ligase family protein n=1 Tax=Aquimarina mycalae TaxID=3040073 RepID=UPI002477D35A|nr:O-antigen ligase family protein [Aquimarina sp. 2201CG14-23]MDH7446378.1 O-antigen ligase family protein [Aquimarina sp. 2201CG14-23]
MKKDIFLKLYAVIFCLLLFSIPFNDVVTALPNIFLIALAVLFPFCFKKEMLLEIKKLTVLIYFFLVVYVSFSIWFRGGIDSEMSQLGKLYVPLSLFILSLPITKKIKLLQTSLMIGVFLIVLASLSSIGIYVYKQGEFSFSNGSIINEILLLERVYIAFLCVISFIFSLHLLNKTKGVYKKILILNSIVVVGFVLTIAARMAILSMVLIAIYYIVRFLNKKKVFYTVGIISIVISIFFIGNKNLQKRFFYTDQNNVFIENLKIWEPRMVIWPCVYDIVNSDDFEMYMGFRSYKTSRQELVNCYSNKIEHPEKKKWFLYIKYNTHNQFLDFLLVAGFLGFLCFISIFVSALWGGKNSFLKISLVIAFVLLGLVENYLHRQIGAYSFAIFLIMLRNFDSNEALKKRIDE